MAQLKHRVACIPSPGLGHIIPFLELAKKLVLDHGIAVTFIAPTIGPPPEALTAALRDLPGDVSYILLPPVDFEEGVKAETQIGLAISRSLSSVRDVFRSSSSVGGTRFTALVGDTFSVEAFEVAEEFNVPSYLYFSTSAHMLSLAFYMPKLDELISCELRDLQEPVKIPGFAVPIHGRDFPDPLQDRKDQVYQFMMNLIKRYSLAEGILLNTSVELEAGVIEALREDAGVPPIYPIGPLIKTGRGATGDACHECIKWLDNQAGGSVLFVSFGSGGTLSVEQLSELAHGLELSEQKFLWVVKSPEGGSADASFFDVHSETDPFGFLPAGFPDRTKGKGFLVSSWAPQVEVLGHPSTGGFLTHCGWNSTLESISHGVPLISWPLYAEQKMNAVLLSEDFKVALRPGKDGNGLIGRQEIAKVIKCLMQGEEGVLVRDRMNRLKDTAVGAVTAGGSSTTTLSQVALKWKNQIE